MILREKRGFRDLYQREQLAITHKPWCSLSDSPAKIGFYDEVCGFLVMSWALHYLPFFLMQRQLFLHHYLPALYFAVLCFCAVFDFMTSWLRPRTRIQVAAIVLVLTVWSWTYFSPLTYAQPWTRSKCEKAKWLRTWDFSWSAVFLPRRNCKLIVSSDFYENVKKYESSAVIPVQSQKVEEPEAGEVTTTLVVSLTSV